MWKWLGILCIASAIQINAETNVLAFAGSTREDSLNKKLIKEAGNIARELGANVTVIDLRDFPMPFYDGDLEAAEGMPENAKKLRQLMIQSQVILIATPVYNHSIPAVLKNALDWVSRSEQAGRSREAFQGKKIAIMSASPGKTGGANALIHLRDILADQRAIIITQQVSVPDANNAFDEEGRLKNPQIKADLQQLIQEVLK